MLLLGWTHLGGYELNLRPQRLLSWPQFLVFGSSEAAQRLVDMLVHVDAVEQATPLTLGSMIVNVLEKVNKTRFQSVLVVRERGVI